jgi:hypothetical protein
MKIFITRRGVFASGIKLANQRDAHPRVLALDLYICVVV